MYSRPLTREELTKVIEGKGHAFRIPCIIHPWIYSAEVFVDKTAECLKIMSEYPSDAEIIHLRVPDVFNAPSEYPNYRWLPFDNPFPPNTPLDAVSAIDTWDKLNTIIEHFPSANTPLLIPSAPPKGDTYRVAHWWYLLFERLWSLRGMENSLCDFYENPDAIHTLFQSLTNFYKVLAKRSHDELGADAIWTSDDIGMQTGPFFSLEIFRTFFKPYYKELCDYVHSLGMHFWLHCCGNILPFIPELAEIGVDVLHPIQKYTMEEAEVARKYGSQICIWAGFDVQRIIPYGTPEEVRAEVRHLIDTYARDDGRLIMGAGNGITGDTKIESLRALFDETVSYGTKYYNR